MVEGVSIVITVLNEAASLGALLDSLRTQTRPPDEVVIVDGGSTDGTLEVLHAAAAEDGLPIVVLSRPGCNISQGRNIAIEAAGQPLIAATDAGVRLGPDWLERLMLDLPGTRRERPHHRNCEAISRGQQGLRAGRSPRADCAR